MHAVSASLLLVATAGLLTGTALAAPAGKTADAATLLTMERSAMDQWSKGDPEAFLAIYDPDIVYFDPFISQRINGRDALRKWYDTFRGKFRIDHYEFLDPKVEISGDMALLTYNFVSQGSQGEKRWNATEVYRRRDGQWRIIHSHWSLTEPKLAKE
jgi:uncharacterized protein (TIGR02246 family)